MHSFVEKFVSTSAVRARIIASSILRGSMFLLVCSSALLAQQTTATLSGTVVDASGALVPGATATLSNLKNGQKRTTTSNSGGFFVFAAVPTGDYDVDVREAGFKSNLLHNVHLDPADNKSLSRIVLQIGEVTQVINVTASDVGMINSGEKSTLITSNDIQKLSVEGRDVTELVKILPGFAIAQTSAGIDNTTYDPSQVNITGGLRSYAANGNSANGVSLISDGSNITDPGNGGDSIQNVNTDMVEEVKIQTSNFTAETSNGPIVVNAVGKSGTQNFHGEAYIYARTYQLNSQDWLSNYLSQPKPSDRYLYPGANISGPVLIPGTNFNHSKKLTFFVGAEDYAQRNIFAYGSASQALAKALVPTAGMRAGDFSCGQLLQYLGPIITCDANGNPSTPTNANYVHLATLPTTLPNGFTTHGSIASNLNPGALALISTLPLPNRTNPGDGYNYIAENLIDNDLFQGRMRMDYSFSDNIKLFGTYNVERGHAGVPEVPYYSAANSGSDLGGVDTPGGGLLGNVNSQTGGINLTVVFSPRFTNELAFNMSYLNQPFTPKNPSALQSSSIDYPYKGFPTGGGFTASASTQYPQLKDYGYDGLPLELVPDFSTGSLFATKALPSLTDNVTYVLKTHTIKAGAYVQKVTNNQRTALTGSSTNGQISDYYYGSTYVDPNGSTVYTSGNYLANFEEGQIEQFSQQNYAPAQNLYFWNIDWYVTDSWKATSRLSVDLGIRFEHLGPWQDKHGVGLAVFDPSTIGDTSLPQPGFVWHAIDKSVPNSGVPGRFAFYEPRVGLSYDLYGNGKTMMRGGWGMYRSHDNYNVVQTAAAEAQGVLVECVCGGGGISLSQLNNVTAGYGNTNDPGSYSVGSGLTAYGLAKGDSEQPLTYTYSFTVDQQLPKNSTFEIGYTGSHGADLTAQNVNILNLTLENVNPVPLGAFFHPNPVTGAVVPLNLIDSLQTSTINQYRPYPNYGNIDVPRHILYSFYNGLQASWNKQQGHLTYGLNYTWSKALGIKDGYYNGNATDATNLRNNYGPLSFDRSQIFNASYAYDFGNPYKGRRLLGAVLNGWQISGITTFQAGPNLQATYVASNFNLTGTLGTGATALNVDDKTFLGTPDVLLQPVLTCDPSVHTAHNQFVNGNCFRLPQIGQNGPFNYPYLHGPAYFDSDLTLAKSITFSKERSLQFRFAAFNFLNHPLASFSNSFPQQVALNLSNLTPGGETQSPGLATPDSTFGTTNIREGRRVVELAVKYHF
jgi:hypothetical protein